MYMFINMMFYKMCAVPFLLLQIRTLLIVCLGTRNLLRDVYTRTTLDLVAPIVLALIAHIYAICFAIWLLLIDAT